MILELVAGSKNLAADRTNVLKHTEYRKSKAILYIYNLGLMKKQNNCI